MALLKREAPELRVERAAAKAAAELEAQAQRDRHAFLNTPVGRAQTAYEQGNHVFQYAHNVMSQQAVIVAMVGSGTKKTSADPSAILNAVCSEGWEIINGSFVGVEEGQQSRDKFMASGQNVATKGTTMGYYLFRRCDTNKRT